MIDLPEAPTTFCTMVSFYFATGEGVTASIVIAPTPEAAKRKFIHEYGEYFTQCALFFDGVPDGECACYADYVPKAVFELAKRIPNFLYCSQFHYNLS